MYAHPHFEKRLRAFSLVEMLVVVGVIALLITLVLIVGRGAIRSAKVNTTKAMLEQVDTAIQAFVDDDPYQSVDKAKKRYGPYPPDDLMAFTPRLSSGDPGGAGHGINGVYGDMPNLMPGGIGKFVRSANGTDPIDDHQIPGADESYVEYGANKALVWSLRNHEKARSIYDAIPDRFKVTVAFEEEFFDNNGDVTNAGDPPQTLIDDEVQYLVDAWDNPIEYYVARNLKEQEGTDEADWTTHGWVAQRIVRANKNLPVLVSYGPDGELQIERARTLEELYYVNVVDPGAAPGTEVFEDPMNEDNVYLDEALTDRIKTILVP